MERESLVIKLTDGQSKYFFKLDKEGKKHSMLYIVGNFEDNYREDVITEIPADYYEGLARDYELITKDWFNNKTLKLSNPKKVGNNIKWSVFVGIKDTEEYISFKTAGEVPYNWNEFIDYLSKIEMIFKAIKK